MCAPALASTQRREGPSTPLRPEIRVWWFAYWKMENGMTWVYYAFSPPQSFRLLPRNFLAPLSSLSLLPSNPTHIPFHFPFSNCNSFYYDFN